MSLQPETDLSIPQMTRLVANAAFPKGNVWIKMREELGSLFRDEQFADLFPPQGQPAEAPWRLALVVVMQFAENLPDRQAADAVRSRIDWKYALALELTDPGFDYSVLSEFRARLLEGQAQQRLLETVLALGRERGWLKARGKQRTDSTHVLAAIHALNRLENAGERQKTEAFQERYHIRAGIEGTLSQGIVVGGMRRSRYIGQAKTHLQNVAIATSFNVLRMVAWLMEVPLSKTRKSRFNALCTQMAASPA
jgi:transposase